MRTTNFANGDGDICRVIKRKMLYFDW